VFFIALSKKEREEKDNGKKDSNSDTKVLRAPRAPEVALRANSGNLQGAPQATSGNFQRTE